jgi:hypothetical protein
MVWNNIQIGKFKVKYTALDVPRKDYPYCDKDGNELKKVSGKFERGHYINEKSGEKHDKAYKLINGKASSGFVGRIKNIENPIEISKDEVEDLLIEKEYLAENQELYNELESKGKAYKFGGWFGNGYKAYRVYVYPSKLYKGFCIMACGRGQKSEVIKELVAELEEDNRMKKKVAEFEKELDNVNKVKVDELIQV